MTKLAYEIYLADLKKKYPLEIYIQILEKTVFELSKRAAV